MAWYYSFKVLNSALMVSSTVVGWSYWLLWGTPESKELKIAKENERRLRQMEVRINQMWAINQNLLPGDTEDLDTSVVLLNKDLTTKHCE